MKISHEILYEMAVVVWLSAAAIAALTLMVADAAGSGIANELGALQIPKVAPVNRFRRGTTAGSRFTLFSL